MASNWQIFISSDSRFSWNATGLLNNWISCAISGDEQKYFAIDMNGNFFSYPELSYSDGWIGRERNRYWASITSSSNGTKLAAVVDGGWIFIPKNSGETWTHTEYNRSGKKIVSSADGNLLFAIEDGSLVIHKSSDWMAVLVNCMYGKGFIYSTEFN